MNGIIYYIYHVESGKGYVGRHNTTKLSFRFLRHCRDSGNKPLANSLRKYGKEAFKVVKLDSAYTDDELNTKEILWIDRLETLFPSGYNLTLGGEGNSGWNPSKETREAISISRSGYPTNLGKTFSQSWRNNMSKSREGIGPTNRKISDEQVRMIRNSPEKKSIEWASELGVSWHCIHMIRLFKTFKNIGVEHV